MGGVAVLHPQDCLKDHRDGFFSMPVKSRRKPSVNYSTSTPNLTRSEGRKRSPPTGVRKNNKTTTTTMVSDPPAKNLVMGQVKILKRGEALDESSSTVLKDANDSTTTPPKDVVDRDRKVSRGSNGGRRVLPAKKKVDKEKKKIEGLKVDDFALSSTDRLGPDPEMVPKQMKKNIADFFFAGSAFVDSPPPSSLPLPGFFTKNFVKEDPSTDLRRMLVLYEPEDLLNPISEENEEAAKK